MSRNNNNNKKNNKQPKQPKQTQEPQQPKPKQTQQPKQPQPQQTFNAFQRLLATIIAFLVKVMNFGRRKRADKRARQADRQAKRQARRVALWGPLFPLNRFLEPYCENVRKGVKKGVKGVPKVLKYLLLCATFILCGAFVSVLCTALLCRLGSHTEVQAELPSVGKLIDTISPIADHFAMGLEKIISWGLNRLP